MWIIFLLKHALDLPQKRARWRRRQAEKARREEESKLEAEEAEAVVEETQELPPVITQV